MGIRIMLNPFKVIKVQYKMFQLFSAMSECFDEINIGEKTVEIKLSKKIIINSKDIISLNCEDSIILNSAKLLRFKPVKISGIDLDELNKVNEVI